MSVSIINRVVFSFQNLEKSLNECLYKSAIIGITDHKGKICFVNDKFCEISGYSRDELIGKDHRIINSGLHPKEYFQSMWATIKSGQVWEGEIRNKKKNGDFYWVLTKMYPVTVIENLGHESSPDEITHFVAIRILIDPQKKLENSLLEANLRNRILVESYYTTLEAISHDVRSGLQVLSGISDILKTSQDQNEIAIAIEKLHENIEKLTGSAVDDLAKKNGRHYSGNFSRQTKIDIEEVVNQEFSHLNTLKSGFPVQVKKSISLPEIWFNLPETIIRSVFFLFGRIICAQNTRLEVKIELCVDPIEKLPQFKIEIPFPYPAEFVKNIFSTYPETLIPKEDGSISEIEFTLLMIRYYVGKFSSGLRYHQKEEMVCFCFDLVRLDLKALPGNDSKGINYHNDPGSRPRILLVDDSEDIILIEKSYLKNAFVEIEAAANGAEAVEKYEKFRPHLILMDLQMPLMDGLTATRKIRNYEKEHSISASSIIAFSAHTMNEDKQNCLAAGCDQFMMKPAKRNTFLETIKQFISYQQIGK